LKPPRQCRKVS